MDNVPTSAIKLKGVPMESVGIRQLKENLSHYMRQVKFGQPLIVTQRKKEIAIIMPFNKKPEEEKIMKLVQGGMASWSGKKPAGMKKRIASKGKNVSEAVIEDRR